MGTKTTSSEGAAKTLAQKREEAERGRALLATLESEQTAAHTDYADDMSIAKRTKVETADGKVNDARVTQRALDAREAAAARTYDAAVDAEKDAELADVTKAADTMALMTALYEDLVVPALVFDREYAKRIDAARAKVREHNVLCERGRKLAADRGTSFTMQELHVDDVRVVSSVALAQQRAADGRGMGAELFLTPIADAFVRQAGGAQVGNPLCAADQFEAARQLLATKEG